MSRTRYIFIAIAVLSLLAGASEGRGGGRGGGGRGGSRGGGSRSSGHGWGGSRSTGHSSSTSSGHGTKTHSSSSGRSWFSWPWSKASSPSHTYPASKGLSGNNAGHAYPPSQGLSGHGQGGLPPYRAPVPGQGHPPPVYQQKIGNQLHQPTSYHTSNYGSIPQSNPYPVYAGQTPVYVQQVRDSGSRYSNIMTGLALWNLGRSHSYHHYYHNSHATNNRNSSSPNSDNTPPPIHYDNVACTLKMSSPEYTEILKVPCDMVSTFMPNKTEVSSASTSNVTSTDYQNSTTTVTHNETMIPPLLVSSTPEENVTSTPLLVKDPLKVSGSKVVVPENMTCTVEVRTPLSFETTAVACDVLLQYSEAEHLKITPTPPPSSPLAPSTAQVRQWYDAPPFWMVVPFIV